MTTPNQTKTITVSDYMRKPESIARFAEVLGDRNASPYIQSVLIAVSTSDELSKCTPQSVMKSALRAASLGLSCDPALKQAWLVPYNKKNRDNTWSKEAQFQPHYKGLYTLAMRTGKYWKINVSAIYEGQRVLEDPLTGLHVVQESNGFIGEQPGKRPGYIDVTERRRTEEKVIGWLGYFKMKNGFEKSVWMSTVEIEDHARKYVRDYDKNPNWNDKEKRQTMEMKTVLRQLLSWADLSGTENNQLVEAMQADEPAQDEPITAQVNDMPEEQLHEMTVDEARDTIIHTTIGDVLLGNMPVDQLNAMYLDDNTTDAEKRAVALILKADYSMDPPEAPKKTVDQIKGQMGF